MKPGGGSCLVPGGGLCRGGVEVEGGGGTGGGPHLVLQLVLHTPNTGAPVLSYHLQPDTTSEVQTGLYHSHPLSYLEVAESELLPVSPLISSLNIAPEDLNRGFTSD